MDRYLVIGQLGRPHGVYGEIRLTVLTDFPARLTKDIIVYIGENHHPLRIRQTRWHQDVILVAFDGLMDRSQAGTLRNQWVYVKENDRPPLSEGEYYHHEWIGLSVFSDEPQNTRLGKISDILETGANDVIVIEREDGSEILLPVIDETIRAVNLAQGKIIIHLLPGLAET